MSEQLVSILKNKLEELAAQSDPEVRRNALKEVLQLYVLNFIYHHPKYNTWVMYGGSALRIIHGLNRMSVDLDFEVPHPVTEDFLRSLKEEIEQHFAKTYNAGNDFLEIKITNVRGLILKFHADSLPLGHGSKQVHVKIDLNHFSVLKAVTERRPINQQQLSFAILTYNMSALMASKLAAIFLREQRGIDTNVYDYKGRDIYDLLWYMGKKVVPDFDYLNEKLKERGFHMADIQKLFDKITVDIINYPKMDELLRQDLFPLFLNRAFVENWIGNWRESYLRLLEQYKIRTITELDRIVISRDFYTDNYLFVFWYGTDDEGLVRIVCAVSEHWIIFSEGDLRISLNGDLDGKIQFANNWSSGGGIPDRLKKYATLFHRKIEAYFKKTNRVMLGGQITTKLVRMTAQDFNPQEQIILNPSTLLSCELEDLLK